VSSKHLWGLIGFVLGAFVGRGLLARVGIG
jgi:hypothetical protein